MVQGLKVASMAPFQEEAAMPPGPVRGRFLPRGSPPCACVGPSGADAAASAGELQ
jgi:hypothetical protein